MFITIYVADFSESYYYLLYVSKCINTASRQQNIIVRYTENSIKRNFLMPNTLPPLIPYK